MLDQLPIISINTAKFESVIRFSVENLLNSGCHVFRQLDGFEKLILMLNIGLYRNIYMTTGITGYKSSPDVKGLPPNSE